jgi:hypothetical protein
MRHAPPERIIRRERAQGVVDAAQGFAGALAVRIEDKRQGPPTLRRRCERILKYYDLSEKEWWSAMDSNH